MLQTYEQIWYMQMLINNYSNSMIHRHTSIQYMCIQLYTYTIYINIHHSKLIYTCESTTAVPAKRPRLYRVLDHRHGATGSVQSLICHLRNCWCDVDKMSMICNLESTCLIWEPGFQRSRLLPRYESAKKMDAWCRYCLRVQPCSEASG